MPYFTPQDLKAMQQELGIKLDKNRGQCYLIDKNIIHLILQYAKLNPNRDYVIEIGAGLGILSDFLIQNSKKVFLIENDRKIAKFLYSAYRNDYSCDYYDVDQLNCKIETFRSQISTSEAKVIIIFGDVLKIPLPNANRVVANIPYQISAPLIFKLIEEWQFDQVNLMVQTEFADRLTASVNSSNYSRLAASVGLFLDVHINHHVNPNSFYPPPRVSSKLITLKRKSPIYVGDFQSWDNKELYLTFLRGVFPHKNKSIRNALKLWLKHSDEICKTKYQYFNKFIENPSHFVFSNEKVRNLTPKTLFKLCIFGITGEFADGEI
ncbi:MAG: 16S rRNA (adenine(1518)-N(6)/adenine(1519)-N(6))-dimethyltransferase RsmA [Candidatus Lokiarchaeota archaeon]|nr:16S rRNA (adenine(1518)-N(6)/adenine(1519)-N(6))-dimethyltransferase RsmA [Candidatus Harpocratesius repetitus]